MDFQVFFEMLTPNAQEEFARRARYSAYSMRMHFCAPGFRRRAPSGKGFARLVAACEYFHEKHGLEVPSQTDLFDFFYRISRARPRPRYRRRSSRTTAAAA
jgi:hypothetical protein